MEISVRNVGAYKEVIVVEGDVRINLGWLNKEERLALARTLEEAVDELLEGYPPLSEG